SARGRDGGESGRRLRRLLLLLAGLTRSREGRHDAEHALEEDQLSARMHLVLFRTVQARKARLRVLAGGIRDHLREKLRRQRLEPRRELLALALEQCDDLGLR